MRRVLPRSCRHRPSRQNRERASGEAQAVPDLGPGDDDISTTMPAATFVTPATTILATTPAGATGNDVESFSRHDLQGASCVTGGVLRGRAQGNVYNMADDMEIADSFTKSVLGKFTVSD